MQNLNAWYASLYVVLVFAFFGLHDVSATYGYDQTYDENSMSNSQQVSNSSNSKNILVDNSSISVNYGITNGNVLSIQGNNQSRSVLIHTKTTGEGMLSVTLPRDLIDSKINGVDDKFFVSIDGQEEPFDETKATDHDRTLNIPFNAGVKEIEIMGTKAVPEFGMVTSLVYTIAIISVMIFFTKIKISSFYYMD